MISPPVTVWPAKTLTPRRCAFESRPLRDEPRPFLCAIFSLRGSLGLARARCSGQLDVVDLDARQFLTVAVAALVTALRLELDDTELGATFVADDRCCDLHLGDFLAIDDLVAVYIEQRGQRHAIPVLCGQPLNEQVLTL